MASSAALYLDSVTLTKADAVLAKTAEAALIRVAPHGETDAIPLAANLSQQSPVSIPARVYTLLLEILHELGAGRTVAVSVVDEELTTRQAADMLGVSRPFLIGLVEQGVLPHRLVGTHRRLRTTDVLEYKKRVMRQRLEALRTLTAEGEALGLYDDE